ncbi:MAG TPA: DNRLRE domain-containing protein, partial [Lacipirellulaceae bacterium]|nr:DNRLRE domain-containing protein [Lacipirellulaceae bacterium]
TLTFNPGESFKDVTVAINAADGLAEGFERFRLVLSNASAGYQITNGSPTSAGNPNGEATITITDANVSLAVFQNGVNGYSGTKDAYLDGEFTTDFFGQDPVIRVDQAKGASVGAPQQGLIRFDEMFGGALGQVPLGSQIFDAFLTLNVSNTASGGDIRFFRMLQDWEQVTASWESPQGAMGAVIQNGVTPDGFEAAAQADAVVTEPGKAGKVQIPLNVETIQSWANGSLANNGWSIVSNSPSLWSFNSSEAFLAGTFKPELTILYTAPEAASTGTFRFSVDAYTVNESGGAATITVNRVGGSAGAAAVNWAAAPGTATLADVTGASAGVLNFAAGELFKTFNIAINNDALLERNETLNLTLTGAGLTFSQAAATLTIRDNDFSPASGNLLLNEIFMNSPGNDPPHEFVELAGLANMGLGSLYYVAVEGLVGANEGAFDKVVDLGPYMSGSNGLTLLTPQEPGYAFNVNPATTHIQDLGTVAVENVNTNNDSVTIMILYSPSRELSTFGFDYDWNNDGSLDLPTGVQVVDSLGVRTLGLSDQVYGPTSNILAFTATEVDSVSRKRSDSDRNDGTAWFGGNLTSAGDDYLLYEASSTSLPATGASMSPGDLNAGSAAQSPLVALTGVTVNPNGTVTVAFNGPISQVLSGDGSIAAATGSGVSITDPNGVAIPVVDVLPTVTGIGTNTLTLAFTGSGVAGGKLPAGSYQLNFVGNGFVGNSRAVDVANNGTQVGGSFEFEFAVAPATLAGDYDGNGRVDGNDFVAWQRSLGTPAVPSGSGADGNNSGSVDAPDLDVWSTNFGLPAVAAAVPAQVAVAASVTAAVDAAVFELTSPGPTFGTQPRVARAAFAPSRSVGYDLAPRPQSPLTPSDARRAPQDELDALFAELGDESDGDYVGLGRALVVAL